MTRKWILMIIMAAVLVLFAACGGQDDYVMAVIEPTPTPTPTPEPAVEEYEPEEVYLGEAEEEGNGLLYIAESQDETYYVPHGEIAVGFIEFINDNLYGRSPFTYREKEAALWLVEELLAMGHPYENIEIQEFYKNDVLRWIWHGWDTPTGQWILGDGVRRYYSQNVILTVPGQSERKIIVGAHYDTLPYPGASDNASGMGLLLESAWRMLYEENYHTIVYVFFGAEEIGLVGAHVYLYSLGSLEHNNIVFMVNADVLFEGPYMRFGAARHAGGGTLVANDITRQVGEIALGVYEAHGIEIIDYPASLRAGSDHLPFKWAGHTVVFLSGMDRVEGGRFVTRVLHSPRDDFHYINEQWPGKIDTNMRYFSIFLEEMLLARFE